MGRLFIVEFRKLRSLNIRWLVIAGGVLPGIIACLTLYNQEKTDWLGFIHRSLLSFNVQSLLTFASFATFMWAREYEENTMELVLCYPYRRFYLVLAKLSILFLVIVATTVIFLCTTLIVGGGMFHFSLPQELLWKLMKALIHTGIIHFLLLSLYLCIAMVTKSTISGLIFGILNMCICMSLSHTSVAQYIPQCIPYVIGDHQLGVNSLVLSHNLWVYYGIVVASCLAALFIIKVMVDRLKK